MSSIIRWKNLRAEGPSESTSLGLRVGNGQVADLRTMPKMCETHCSLALTPRAAGTLSGVGCPFELTPGVNARREVYGGTRMPTHVSCM